MYSQTNAKTNRLFWIYPFTLLLLFGRIFLGVDFTDEGFYASIPYRFFLGDRPFVDETAIHQTAGFLTYPFVSSFVSLTGSTSGLILYLRSLYWLFIFGVSYGVWFYFRSRTPQLCAALLASIFVFLIPGVPTLNYNSLGIGYILLALIFEKPSYKGICLGLATVAYIPLVLMIVPLAVILWNDSESSKRRVHFTQFGVAFFLALLPLTIPLFQSGLTAILESYRETSTVAPKGGGFLKLLDILRHTFHNFITTLVPTIIAWAMIRHAKSPWLKSAATPAFVAYLCVRFGMDRIPDFISTTALMLPLLTPTTGLYNPKNKQFGLFVSSLVCGLITAWASTNGGVNFYLGAIPAFLLALSGAQSRIAILPMVLIFLVGTSFLRVYRDRPAWELTTPIKQGPHAGLFTNENKADLVSDLILASATNSSSERVVYMNDFPAGFLYSSLLPATSSTWVFTPWNPKMRDFRLIYLDRIKKYQDEGIDFFLLKVDARSAKVSPLELITDDLDTKIKACAGATIYESKYLVRFQLKPNCI